MRSGYYHGCQTFCNLLGDATLKAKERQARLQQQPVVYNIKLLSDTARGWPSTEPTSQPRASSSTKSSGLEARSGHYMRLYKPSEITSIEKADDSRPYNVIKGQNGESILMHGALIPEHYDLDGTFPGSAWICPVRSCRTVFKRIVALGTHFNVSILRRVQAGDTCLVVIAGQASWLPIQ